MKYGICNLSVIPVRIDNNHDSEQVNQLLFGEYFIVLEELDSWHKIESSFDNSIGWIDKKQYLPITENDYHKLDSSKQILAKDFLDFVFDEENNMLPVTIGSLLPYFSNNTLLIGDKEYNYEGEVVVSKNKILNNKNNLVDTAFTYLNAPFLWGGKSPLGIDCSGFTQMVYKLNGIQIPRTSAEQAKYGEVLSFIEESEPGDLAFFDNEEGIINHVGIILEDNYIIHSHGKVRIDRIDHTGIYNIDTQRHSHKLRVIKKIC
jgi:hypothetical protein